MKKSLFVFFICFFSIKTFAQLGNNGHTPFSPLSYDPTGFTGGATTFRQGTTVKSAGKPSISNADATYLFANFTFDTQGKNVYLVYTNDGSIPTKTNGNVIACNLSRYSEPNRTWVAVIPNSANIGGSYIKYVFYISNSDINSSFGRIASNTNDWGYSTNWNEGDANYSYTAVMALPGVDVLGTLNVSDQLYARNEIFIYNSGPSWRPTLTLKNDVGETPNPANGGVIQGSANGGAILFKNNFGQEGPNVRTLQLGMVDNGYNFSPAVSIPSASLFMGVGTTTPSERLNVDPGGAGGILIGNSNITSGGFTSLKLSVSAASAGYSTIQSVKSAGSEFGNLVLNPQGGFVGIGTTDALMNTSNNTYGLYVEKGIRTRQVKIDQKNWPDYVFNHKYHLRTLTSLAYYIHANNHLPDVPSSDEVEKEGLDMGATQAVLLRKIEELTLYVIKQDAENKVLHKQLNTLAKKVKGLEKDNR